MHWAFGFNNIKLAIPTSEKLLVLQDISPKGSHLVLSHQTRYNETFYRPDQECALSDRRYSAFHYFYAWRLRQNKQPHFTHRLGLGLCSIVIFFIRLWANKDT